MSIVYLVILALGATASGDEWAVLKTVGSVMFDADQLIIKSTDAVLAGDVWSYLGLAAGILTIYTTFALFMKIFDWTQAFESQMTRFMMALIFYVLIAIAVNAVLQHDFILPFRGVYYLFQNIVPLSSPIAPYAGNYSNVSYGNPLF